MTTQETKNKVRELIRKLPELCGARGSWGRSGEIQYIDELEHPEFYPRIQGESFQQRCESYVVFVHFCDNFDKAIYGIGLLELVNANSQKDEAMAMNLRNKLSKSSGAYADIDAIMTFDEASALLGWSPE